MFVTSIIFLISGEVLGELLSILTNPQGLKQLTQLPRGSAEVELMGLLPIYYVYHFLESTEQWGTLGKDLDASNKELKGKIKAGRMFVFHCSSTGKVGFLDAGIC